MRAQIAYILVAAAGTRAAKYSIQNSLITANQPFADAFVSYSIEFSSFPDFAGNNSVPNTYSNNLLNNIGNLTGTKPYIRVGGNTQDYALYNSSLDYALNGTFNYNLSSDYPTTIFIGPSYFESYAQWPDVKFSHGFNLAKGANNSAGWQTLLDTVPLACQALSHGNLYMWEYGNEPDLYSTSSQGPVRPTTWNESWYVSQWLNGTQQIKASLQQSCPQLLANGTYGYLAPSFAGVGNHLKLPATWEAGLDKDQDITLLSTHNYISGANVLGVTLQGTLLNHSITKNSVNAHITEYEQIFPNGSGVPLIFGETNSLYNEGRPGLSNTFGAALWGVDFNLYSASVGIKRVHMHMGTNYRYGSWQPIETVNATIGTKAPYYGNIAVAAFLGNTLKNPVSIAEIPLADDTESAYAAYSAASSELLRTMVINMNTYNTTLDGSGLGEATNLTARTVRVYTFDVGGGSIQPGDLVGVQRLSANGSDAITGITWDGYSFNYELDEGKPVRLANSTLGEYVVVKNDSTISIGVPDSSAAVLNFALNVSALVNGTGGSW
ncbi:glycoside hydrolase family 79 protein [Coniella lustricola]|uniref:Glycoside hydrolase family 79 protein n=1 Tax=Coniella lustricola TaxID=2025994 RepID=A0A2T3A9C6_9PEZI|nr:glycoside hydrolase family 79 protein [Coniella lustricola]